MGEADARSMVEVRGVGKTFGETVAVDDASFTVSRGAFLTILGPSGCGKTTLLRMIAGFLTPTAGEIRINGEAVAQIPPYRRSIGMVFQRLALFPHMTAAQNVAYPLKMRRFPREEIPARVARMLDLVRLTSFRERRPHELSGGQQQRVAIARALVFGPDLLLLDEPLSALDRKLREDMQLEFRRIQQELGVTTINVTHDQREALVMSDRIVVMNEGVIQQANDPVAVYRQPSNRFVAGFIGLTAFLHGTTVASPPARAGEEAARCVRVGAETLRARAPGGTDLAEAGPVECAIRAEQVRVLPAEGSSGGGAAASFDNVVAAVVVQRIFEGDRLVYELHCPSLGDARVYAFDSALTDEAGHGPGEAVRIGFRARDVMLFPA